MTSVTNINDVLDGHVGLDLSCIDRLYLNAYVPNMAVGGQVARFLTAHLGNPIPSPALLQRIGNRFRHDVKAFAEENGIPILHLKKPDRSRWDDRKLDHVRPFLDQAEREGRFGVVAIVQAQEFQWVFSSKDHSSGKLKRFDFVREERRVGIYYFYLLDPDFGPGFIKIATYFPFPTKVWLNGHEWAKRQAHKEGLVYTSLANGFASCADPARLQEICDRLGPDQINAFFSYWTTVIPVPWTEADRAAGYFWDLSMRQVEVSRTLVFNDPRRARRFFEALVCRQRRHRPARRGLRRLRPPGDEEDQRALRDPHLLARHRRQAGFSLQAQPGQAVFERRESPTYRNRHQQGLGPEHPLAHRASARAGAQGSAGQQPGAYDRTCRPGLCHRLCAL